MQIKDQYEMVQSEQVWAHSGGASGKGWATEERLGIIFPRAHNQCKPGFKRWKQKKASYVL